MSIPQFAIVRLSAAHDRAIFASGDEPLDRCIKEQNALRRTEAQRELPMMFLVVDAYE